MTVNFQTNELEKKQRHFLNWLIPDNKIKVYI